LTFFEDNKISIATQFCEPMFSKRKIYPTLSFGRASTSVKNFRNIIAYSDGKTFLFEIAKKIKIKINKTNSVAKFLERKKLIKYLN
jgi:aminopeptidase-like protein